MFVILDTERIGEIELVPKPGANVINKFWSRVIGPLWDEAL